MKKHIPQRVTNGIKKGFSAPDKSWFRGDSIDYVKTTLYNSKSSIYEFFDQKAVLDIVNQHLNGNTNRRLLIWSLLNIECWLGHYKG